MHLPDGLQNINNKQGQKAFWHVQKAFVFYIRKEVTCKMENPIKLSERLQCVASYLKNGTTFADIGSDHAYLPCYVCWADPKATAIAGELNKGPYESALSTVAENKLQGRIDVRHGDGLSVIASGEVEEVTIAGMGGSLIASILETGKERLKGVQKIIAQPNVDARSTRNWLTRNGYKIADEMILEEKGHIYEIISAVYTGTAEQLTEQEALFGPILLSKKSDTFFDKWHDELEKVERALGQMTQAVEKDMKKINRFKTERKWIQEVLTNG